MKPPQTRKMLTGKSSREKPGSPGVLPPDRRNKHQSFARAAGSYVPKLTAKAFEKFGFHTAEIMTQWPQIAGAEFAAWTEPERIRWPRRTGTEADEDNARDRPGGIITLRVEPARALDVEYRGAEIIERINRYFGYRAIDTLKIVQAPISRSPSTAAETTPHDPPPAPQPGETPEVALQRALQHLAAQIDASAAARSRR